MGSRALQSHRTHRLPQQLPRHTGDPPGDWGSAALPRFHTGCVLRQESHPLGTA